MTEQQLTTFADMLKGYHLPINTQLVIGIAMAELARQIELNKQTMEQEYGTKLMQLVYNLPN